MAEGAIDSAIKLTESLENLLKSSNNVQDSLNKFGGASPIFTNLESAVSNFGKTVQNSLANFLSFTTGVAGGTGIIGENLSKSLGSSSKLLTDLVGKTTGFVSGIITAFEGAVDAFDAPSKGIRDLDANMYNLGARFGESTEKSREFSDSFNYASVSKFAETLNLSNREVLSFINATGQTSLTLDQLNEVVETGIGKVNLFSAATGIARATGFSASEAVMILNKAINQQGKTTQEAVDEFGAYIDVSKNTGLAIDKVATTLSSATDGFRNLGLSVDFGRPILESYARVVKDIGLGVEQSTGLTQNFTNTLAGLTQNYSNAYLLFQRGGLNIPGLAGAQQGLLGASIGMRQALREAEKGGEQGDIARSLAESVRDTIKSLTGGSIVTLEEASKSPALQTQFYTQEQLLTSQFGFSDPTLVLDLLSKIDDSISTGDEESRAKLEDQLMSAAENAENNMDASEKLRRVAEQQLSLASIAFREESMYLRTIAESIAGFGKGVIRTGAEAAGTTMGAAEDAMKKRDDILKKLSSGTGAGSIDETSKLLQELSNITDGNTEDIFRTAVAGGVAQNMPLGSSAAGLPEAIGSEVKKALSGINISISLNTTASVDKLIQIGATTASVAQDVATGQQSITVLNQGGSQ